MNNSFRLDIFTIK